MEDLKVYYYTRSGIVKAVDRVRLALKKGETLGVVGESGCGKSTLGFSIMRLIPPPGRIAGGRIFFDGMDMTQITDREMREIRGRRISMVFQDPMTSLDPLMKIGDHLVETLTVHEKISKDEALSRAEALLDNLAIPAYRINDYPHQFSGGMRQRVAIALALALNPDIVIADEPTTALDVIVQAQILDLMKRLKKIYDMALILISHDVSVVLEIADKIAVMYGGQIMEYSNSVSIFEKTLHPYTQGLFQSIPNILLSKQEITSIPGMPPDLIDPPQGCRFQPRCPYAMSKCREKEPPDIEADRGHLVKCFLYEAEG